ncbi:flavin reductase [Roseomonas sp. M0104]|uniref:Flavin reductase n=1 Tax=Teichococcus coralli TaxID=2545983 RepID=A0A845BFZ9_9PROT|nr:flavin reductase family protein [Pseudoroseomonas coralli]MXP64974.1 flavin reductase [Pseudoroseomonas coralli]
MSAAAVLPAVEAAEFRRCMRSLAGAVAVITCGEEGARTGLTATAVCSLTDLPPMLLACVNNAASAHPVIRRTGRFAVNILSEAQLPVAGRFAGRDGAEGEQRFAGAFWTHDEDGTPLLADALASFGCALEAEHRHGSHSIFVGRVTALRASAGSPPLLYHEGRFGTFAASA